LVKLEEPRSPPAHVGGFFVPINVGNIEHPTCSVENIQLILQCSKKAANVAPAFSLSSPDEERAGVRSLRVHGEILASFPGEWCSGLRGKDFYKAHPTLNAEHRMNFPMSPERLLTPTLSSTSQRRGRKPRVGPFRCPIREFNREFSRSLRGKEGDSIGF
jgi:hypothetical protein